MLESDLLYAENRSMILGQKNLRKDVYLIAEAGSNHDGEYRLARELVLAAARAGADAVKFQLFTLESLIAADSFERLLKIPDSSWREGFRKLEFPLPWLPKLKRVADQVGIDLLSTPFDLKRLEYSLRFDPPAIKIASGDITFRALLEAAGKSGKPVILSCGAAVDAEIAGALAETGSKKTVLLDCVMSYPAAASTYGLKRFRQLADQYGTPVGLSDHTESPALAALLVHRGACVVEKHFTLDRSRPGGDHAMSMDPVGFAVLAASIRDALALRSEKKGKRGDEGERIYARRAVYARRDIAPGEVLNEENTIPLRPASGGMTAWDWGMVLGKKADKHYTAGACLLIDIKRKNC